MSMEIVPKLANYSNGFEATLVLLLWVMAKDAIENSKLLQLTVNVFMPR